MRPIAMLPNILTTMNIVCGFWAMTLCLAPRDLPGACWLLILAAVFDGLDGRVARWAKVSSKFGIELDSLADALSFGAAPAMVIYAYALEELGPLGRLLAITYVVCGVLRLARFNVGATDPTPQSAYFFQGSPIPAAAGLMVSIVLYGEAQGRPLPTHWIAGITLYASLMMVSSFPFPSAKKAPKTRSGRMLMGLVPACILVGLVVFRQRFLLGLALAYMASGPLFSLTRRMFRLNPELPPESDSEGEATSSDRSTDAPSA